MKTALSLIMAVLIGLCFTPAWAQEEDFGTGNMTTWLTSWDFEPTVNSGFPIIDLDQYGVFNFMERWSQRVDLFDITNIGVWAAGIHLDDGVRLVSARLYAYDRATPADVFPLTNADIEIRVMRERLFVNGPPVRTTRGPIDTNFEGGYTVINLPVNFNISNLNNFYWVRVDTNATAGFETGVAQSDFRHRLLGVRLLWFRQISPAPATPTFHDVPAGHIFFQEIEALAASGITLGCGGGNFCPDDYVTRGQMAAFFSRGLGL
jgi:hypothetical protein